MRTSWRQKAKPIIAAVIAAHPLAGPERDKAMFDAYPFGERQYHPYKIWLDEIKAQTGRKGENTAQRKEREGQMRLAEYEAVYGRREA